MREINWKVKQAMSNSMLHFSCLSALVLLQCLLCGIAFSEETNILFYFPSAPECEYEDRIPITYIKQGTAQVGINKDNEYFSCKSSKNNAEEKNDKEEKPVVGHKPANIEQWCRDSGFAACVLIRSGHFKFTLSHDSAGNWPVLTIHPFYASSDKVEYTQVFEIFIVDEDATITATDKRSSTFFNFKKGWSGITTYSNTHIQETTGVAVNTQLYKIPN